jgi:hypothetical protein
MHIENGHFLLLFEKLDSLKRLHQSQEKRVARMQQQAWMNEE